MARDEEKHEPIRVTDRRRLTEEGDVRPDGGEGDEPQLGGTGPSVEEGPGPGHGEGPPASGPSSRAPDSGADSAEGRLPAPDMEQLGIQAVFLAFWQSAMLSLGAPDGSGKALPVDLDGARQSIALLKVLERKTAGNLTADEEAILRRLLHEAQLTYVQVSQALGDRTPGGGSA